MSIFAKSTTYGLDSSIKEMQEYLDTKLGEVWAGTIEIYGRVFPSENKSGDIVPEAYIGTGIKQKEYSPIFINDKVAATVGFLVIERDAIARSANVDIIFTVLIDEIYPTITRDTDRALLQTEKIINSFGRVAEVLDIKEGIDDVFAGFDNDSAFYFIQGKNPDGTDNPTYEKHVDLDNLIDFMVGVFFTGNQDMPTSLGNNGPNNFWAIRPRDGTPCCRQENSRRLPLLSGSIVQVF